MGEERTQADHEAAAREILIECFNDVADAYLYLVPVIAAALSEAVRVAVEKERERAGNLVHVQRCYPYHEGPLHGGEECRRCTRLDLIETAIRIGAPNPSARTDAQATPAPVATPERLQE